MKRIFFCVILVLFSTSAFALPVIPSQATLGFSGELGHEGETYDVQGSVLLTLRAIEDDLVAWDIQLTGTNRDVSVTGYFFVPHDGELFDWARANGDVSLNESVLPDYYLEAEDAWLDRTFDSDHEMTGELAGLGTDIFPRHMDLHFDQGGGHWGGAYFSADLYGQPVPEPATLLLLGTGILGVAGYRRKSKNNE